MSLGIQAYRRLLRSVQKAFGNDKYALKNARIELKKEFVKSKDVVLKNELVELFKGVEEVDEMLNFHLVQASLNQRGNYGMNMLHSSVLNFLLLLPAYRIKIECRATSHCGSRTRPASRTGARGGR